MKILKILGLIFLLILIAFATIPAFLPSSGWKVDVATEIEAETGAVFAKVYDLSTWEKWTMWSAQGGSIELEGPTTGPGAKLHWDSQGSRGTLTVTGVTPSKQIAYETTMEGGAGASQGTIDFERKDGKTVVSWKESGAFMANGEKIEGGVGGYFMRYGGIAMQTALSAGFEQNLQRLKQSFEKVEAETGSEQGGEAEGNAESGE